VKSSAIWETTNNGDGDTVGCQFRVDVIDDIVFDGVSGVVLVLLLGSHYHEVESGGLKGLLAAGLPLLSLV
jgi:hypothetical protein